MSAPYAEMDPPVRALVRVVNRFPGVHTYTSCGGHPAEEEPWNDCRVPPGMWYVDFHVDRTDAGWITLEFFGWVAHSAQSGAGPDGVVLEVLAKPPFLNYPGEMLFFRWAGVDPEDPDSSADAFAVLLTDLRRQFYVTAAQARRWRAEETG